MSKNFELLYQMGKAQEMLQADATVPVTQTVLPEAPASTPALHIEGMAREEVSKLVHRVFFLPGAEAPRHIVFAGTESGDGCTWMAAHAAEILASQVSGMVCVVDCNLVQPSLHLEFDMENSYGLADALLGEDPIRQYARQTARGNLWSMSAGTSTEAAQRVLTSDRMRARISQLRADFDYVLMDVAALNVSNQAMVLGGLSDGVVLVLKAHSARRDSSRESVQLLQNSNVRVLGAVLNQRTFPIPERLYKRL